MAGYSQDFFNKTNKEYQILKKEIWKHFQTTYLPVSLISKYESEMLPFLKKEIKKVRLNRWCSNDSLMEINKVVQFFYFREKGEKVSYKDMNPYVREFLNRHNAGIFNDSPFEGKNVHDGLIELLNHRLKLPAAGPEEIFKKWLPVQFQKALDNIPEPILEEGGFGKVCRVMGGVFLYALTGLDGVDSMEIAKSRLKQALKGGYYFGMFYPLIDDILDHPDILSRQDKKTLVEMLDHWIIGDFSIDNVMISNPSIRLLEDIFKEFHVLFPLEKNHSLYRSALILFFAQTEDGEKTFDKSYSSEELYVSVIIKAAYTRILAASISGIEVNDHLFDHMHKVGLNLQLMDDFRDWFSDYHNKQFTPFTNYLLGHPGQEINPFALYMTSLRIHFARFNDDPFLVNLFMRRLTISIQKINNGNSHEELNDKVWSVIYQNNNIGEMVQKINQLNYKVFDPDIEFTKPIDHIVNRGRLKCV